MSLVPDKNEVVVLIHGLWLSGWSLAKLARGLERCGFDTRRFCYPSMRADLRQNAEHLDAYLRAIEAPAVHLVGHSLGGVLIRALFHYHPAQRPGRIVTVASPHHGSRAARRLARWGWGRRLLGRGAGVLLTPETAHWPLPAREIGTVSGSLGLGLGRLIAPDLPRPNDGVLALAETQLAGSRDRVVLAVSHTGMLLSARVVRALCEFLRHGRFRP